MFVLTDPNDKHFNLYASPMKIFELAACGIPVLASNIQGHLELEELNLGIVYFQHDCLDICLRVWRISE